MSASIDWLYVAIQFGLLTAVSLGTLKAYLVWTSGVCTSKNKMTGKTVVITGANSGIGKATALDLANRGARVILACRDVKKAAIVRDEIIKVSGNENVVVRHLDLASLKSVRRFAFDILKSETHLDILINNAGCAIYKKKMTVDGLEYQMQSNYFGHFLLTNLLLDLLKKSVPSRVIQVSSISHAFTKNLDLKNLNAETSYSPTGRIYSYSKLCQVLNTRYLAQLLKYTGVTVNCLHPGSVKTNIFKNPSKLVQVIFAAMGPWFKTPMEGAQTSIHLAVADEVADITGEYFSECKIAQPSKLAQDKELARKLWKVSERMVKLKPEERHYKTK